QRSAGANTPRWQQVADLVVCLIRDPLVNSVTRVVRIAAKVELLQGRTVGRGRHIQKLLLERIVLLAEQAIGYAELIPIARGGQIGYQLAVCGVQTIIGQ